MQTACKSVMVTPVSNAKIYERTSNDKVEKIKIDFSRQLFTYEARRDTQRYIANGSFTIFNKDEFRLEFPDFSELEEISIFPQGYHELTKKDSSSNYHIDLTILDLESHMDVHNFNAYILGSFPRSVEEINNERTLIIKTHSDSITMRIERQGLIREDVIIPERGKYHLKVFIPDLQTSVGYETTTKGCYMITSNPTVILNVCRMEDGEIRELGLRDDCANPFKLIQQE